MREGACIGAATMLQPWTSRLIEVAIGMDAKRIRENTQKKKTASDRARTDDLRINSPSL